MAALKIPIPMRPINGGRLDLSGKKIGVWYHTIKFNGHRALVHLPSGAVFNRHQAVFHKAPQFLEAIKRLCVSNLRDHADWVDVETLGVRNVHAPGSLVLLDYIPTTNKLATFTERMQRIGESDLANERLAPLSPLNYTSNTVYRMQIFSDDQELWAMLKEGNAKSPTPKFENWFFEGIVSKRADSPYVCGRTHTSEDFRWVKYRYV